MFQVTAKTNVGEVLALYPQLKTTLQKFGIPFSG
jgi:hypothetical protein